MASGHFGCGERAACAARARWRSCGLVASLAAALAPACRAPAASSAGEDGSAAPALASPTAHAVLAPPRETSGVTRAGDALLVVGDDEHGFVYRAPLLPAHVEPGAWTEIPLSGPTLERFPLAGGPFAADLEGVALLADGRVVVLSERLAALVGEDDFALAYPKELFELGNRGLEGLAVRALASGDSRVAVLWEGGHLHPDLTPPELVERGLAPFLPRLLVHDVPRGASPRAIAASSIPLRVPTPPDARGRGLVFRAPDLVWHVLPDGELGWLVLLASESADRTLRGRERYPHRWLVRFRVSGEPLPGHVDLDALAPPALRGANWEGLAWLAEGERMVLVYDGVPSGAPSAWAFDLPDFEGE